MKAADIVHWAHNPSAEIHWVSRLRENLTSGSDGEGLETDLTQIPRQSFTRQDFFKWWKEHLKVYHLIARSEYGLMVQILAGLITYLLLAIYCQEQFNEKVSIKRVRQLRTAILNDLITGSNTTPPDLSGNNIVKDQQTLNQAKT